MKIKFFKEKDTSSSGDLVMSRITEFLHEQGYIVTDKTSTAIRFKDNSWQVRSRMTIFRKIDKGEFDLIPSGGKTVVKFTYYVSFLPEILIAVAFTVLGLINGFNYYVLIIVLLFFIQFFVRVSILKGVSENIIKNVTG